MIDLAGIKEGDHVIDIAAGAGESSTAIAKRVGSNGSVLAIDISSTILDFAARHARIEGVSNLETRVGDADSLSDLQDSSFDAAVSRFGADLFSKSHRLTKRNPSCPAGRCKSCYRRLTRPQIPFHPLR